MKPTKGKASQLEILRGAQKESKEKAVTLYLARAKHRSMKSAFRGIMSYPQRKILHKLGQNHGK